MRYIILLGFLTSCGMKHEVDVSGTVQVEHKLDVSQIQQYFLSNCSFNHPTYTAQQLTECANAELGALLNFIYGSPK